jgi:hypothetical protein
LMSTHDGRIDHRVFVVGVLGQTLEDPLPDAGLDPIRPGVGATESGTQPGLFAEARGRSERMFGTLQDRLMKELAKAGIGEPDAANAWIRDAYLPAHNARFARPAALADNAFVAAVRPFSPTPPFQPRWLGPNSPWSQLMAAFCPVAFIFT